jgi:hypothetical protein
MEGTSEVIAIKEASSRVVFFNFLRTIIKALHRKTCLISLYRSFS